ncbi:hypothetical protein [Gemmatimonas aurantiaca]|nr:hypothetical protein [Gemmatimonas aurantiaca]
MAVITTGWGIGRCRRDFSSDECIMTNSVIAGLFLTLGVSNAELLAQAAPPVSPASLTIELAGGSSFEQRGREQLDRLLVAYDLSPWLFTRTVRIQSRVVPHSHPVLTVNTAYLANDTAQLATFLHEQLHWWFAGRQAATDAAMGELQQLYPDAPDGPPLGARDRQSTYLHLLVCLGEFDVVRQLFGEAVARRTLAAWQHYPWVYREVLERQAPIRAILDRHSLTIPGTMGAVR